MEDGEPSFGTVSAVSKAITKYGNKYDTLTRDDNAAEDINSADNLKQGLQIRGVTSGHPDCP